jgi:Fur family transcriptional regulator, peroxide stress response regulator
MESLLHDLNKKLSIKGLKITPQRIAVLEAIYTLNNHPTAENIIDFVHKKLPNVATGTVYQILDTLVDNKIVKRVKTDKDIMRYDGITDHHHHLYCSECELIEDYFDEKLDNLLKEYFKNNSFKGFTIEDIVLQIRGTFDKC